MSPSVNQTKTRGSIACDRCQRRRTRCVGGHPCEYCTSIGKGDTCEFRERARPNRKGKGIDSAQRNPSGVDTSTSITRSNGDDSASSNKTCSFAAFAPAASSPNTLLSGSIAPRTDTLSTNESHYPDGIPFTNGLDAVPHQTPDAEVGNSAGLESRTGLDCIAWSVRQLCETNCLDVVSPNFADRARLHSRQSVPLPQGEALIALEDSLIADLRSISLDFRVLDHIDQASFFGLYGRYRRLPETLLDDQKAYVNTVLCVARYSRNRIMSIGSLKSALLQDDVTYYRSACSYLIMWSRASTTALWALFCLLPYIIATGGPEEMSSLLSQMTWQIRQLGLLDPLTASLYPSKDKVQLVVAAFQYYDTLISTLNDSKPLIGIEEYPSNVLLALATLVPGCLVEAHRAAAFRPSPQTAQFDNLNLLLFPARLQNMHDNCTPRIYLLWADIRYNWLEIIHSSKRSELSSIGRSALLARSASQIIHAFAELGASGDFSPAWPQIHQVCVSGQLILLCLAAGGFQRLEAANLLKTILALLNSAEHMWASLGSFTQSLSQAMATLGVTCDIGQNLIFVAGMRSKPHDGFTAPDMPQWNAEAPVNFDIFSFLTDF